MGGCEGGCGGVSGGGGVSDVGRGGVLFLKQGVFLSVTRRV